MKQYRITTANFYSPGESGEPDAYIDPDDLQNLRAMTGDSGIIQSLSVSVPPLFKGDLTVADGDKNREIIREIKYDRKT